MGQDNEGEPDGTQRYWLSGMNCPESVPPAVVEGITRYARQHEGVEASELIASLTWVSVFGCYYFVRHGLWHGVELDGSVHT